MARLRSHVVLGSALLLVLSGVVIPVGAAAQAAPTPSLRIEALFNPSGLPLRLGFAAYPGMNDKHPLAIWTAPGGTQIAWFRDPFGNVLSIQQDA